MAGMAHPLKQLHKLGVVGSELIGKHLKDGCRLVLQVLVNTLVHGTNRFFPPTVIPLDVLPLDRGEAAPCAALAVLVDDAHQRAWRHPATAALPKCFAISSST